jgi:hypothetical protein
MEVTIQPDKEQAALLTARLFLVRLIRDRPDPWRRLRRSLDLIL